MKKNILFIVIFFFALTLKTITMLNWHGLTFDEMVSADLAQKKISDVIYYSQWETHPPLYYLVLNLWGHIFGQFEASWRALSLVISLSSLAAFYFLAKELFGKKAGLIAMFLFSISVFFNFYGLWLRMYGLAILLSILSFYFFIKIVNQKNKIYLWIIFYLLATVANLHTHLFSLYSVFAQSLFIISLYLKKSINRQKFIRLSFVIGAGIICFLPWVFFSFVNKLQSLNPNAWYFFDHADELLGLYAIITRLFVLTKNAIVANLSLTILLMILFSTFFIINKEKDGWKIKLDGSNNLLYSLFIFAVSIFSIAITGMFRLRLFSLPAIGLLLLVAYGLSKIKNIRLLIVSLLTIFFLTAPGLYLLAKSTSSGWTEIGAFIKNNEKNGDAIVVTHPNHLLPLKFYYHENLPQIIIGDQAPYSEDLTRAILENNIYSGAQIEEKNTLRNITANKKRIFLVYSGSGFKTDQDNIKNWFIENSWKIYKSYNNESLDNPGVWLLTK